MTTLVIQNPGSKSGNSKKLESILRDAFGDSATTYVKTAHPGHATYIARRAIVDRADTVVAVGGDGTVNEVLNGMAGSSAALGIVPAGTANDLAAYYQIPLDVEKACDVILRRRIHRADLISVNDKRYVTSGGLGFPCEAADIARVMKSRCIAGLRLGTILSSRIYIFASLLAILKTHRQNVLRIRWNGGTLVSDTLSLTINNQPFLGKNFMISPAAVNDDGFFDVCHIENSKSRSSVFSMLLKVLAGRHVRSPEVRMWSADALTIESDRPLSYMYDGEFLHKSKEFTLRVLPRALSVIVPETWGEKKGRRA